MSIHTSTRFVALAALSLAALAACGKASAAERVETAPPTAPAGASAETFCGRLSAFNDAETSPIDLAFMTGEVPAAELEASFTKMRGSFADLALVAPDDIRPSVEILSDSMVGVADFYAKYDYSFEKVTAAMVEDPAASAEFGALMSGDTSTFTTAVSAIDDYSRTVCDGLANN